jgi:elongation factor P
VNLVRDNHEFSYKDGDGYHFIHPETFEDVLIGEDKLDAKTRGYLIEGQKYLVVFADDVVAGIELPANIIMEITDSPAGVKGDSANNVYKEATTESGMRVQVPLFIGPGDKISIKTEDGTYLGRAN